jgi:hypothetical protein
MASAPGKENSGVTHRASRAAMRRRKWDPATVFPVMVAWFGGRRRQRKGPRAPELIEGGETQLQRSREDLVGGTHRVGRVDGGSS